MHPLPPPPPTIRNVPRDRYSHQRQYPFILIISEWEEWLINICWACQEFTSGFCGGLPSARRSRPYVSPFEDATRSSPPLSIKPCVVSQRRSVHEHGRGRSPRAAAMRGRLSVTSAGFALYQKTQSWSDTRRQTDSGRNPGASGPAAPPLHTSRV